METKFETLSHDAVLGEMKMWYDNGCRKYADYETLWQMFRTVVASSSYGSSEFGGPVWIMDFSLANLKKLFPDNPWLEAMEKEKNMYVTAGKALNLAKFSEWFKFRAESMTKFLGLGNVIIKYETVAGEAVILYSWGAFLDAVESVVSGVVERLSFGLMIKWNFSLRESEAVRKGKFFTCLNTATMVKKYPCVSEDADDVKHSDVYGDVYRLKHFSLTKGYVVPETIPEKILMLVINDLMEGIAEGYVCGLDNSSLVCPYPHLKYDKYLDSIGRCGHHFKTTTDVFRWRRKDFSIEEIEVDLPKIDEKYGEFWHRQFPPKQNWRELKD